MDGGAWWAAVHGVAGSQTRLSDFTFTFHFPALAGRFFTAELPGKPLLSICMNWTTPGTSIGEGNGTPLQYSCLENPMDRGAWWAAVHGVA